MPKPKKGAATTAQLANVLKPDATAQKLELVDHDEQLASLRKKNAELSRNVTLLQEDITWLVTQVNNLSRQLQAVQTTVAAGGVSQVVQEGQNIVITAPQDLILKAPNGSVVVQGMLIRLN